MLSRLASLIDRRVVVALLLLLLLCSGLVLWGHVRPNSAHKTQDKILLMSSIPLQWGDVGIGEIAKGDVQPDALFVALSKNNAVTIIDDFQKLGGSPKAVLLLVQPRALAPVEFVQLDSWIRNGGSALIFADPAMDWPSALPLGDPRRLLFTSLLTPMFRHWGLELALPVSDVAGGTAVSIGEFPVMPKSSGIWLRARTKPSASCAIRDDQLAAFCKVGRGRALLIADADLLHEDAWTDTILSAGTMAWLQAMIDALRKRTAFPSALWEGAKK
jgi:hypothetical protein